MSTEKQYIHLISNDEFNYYLEKKVGEQSKYLKNLIKNYEDQSNLMKFKMDDIRGEILEILVDYLNHKFYYENLVDIKKAPQDFSIKDELALDVLIASNLLEI